MMAGLPWFAWIVIVGIIVAGLVAIVRSITGRTMWSSRTSADSMELEHLRRRVELLEAQVQRRR